MTTQESSGLLFAGDLYVSFMDKTTGLFGAADQLQVDKFEIKAPSDQLQKISKGRATFGQAWLTHFAAKPVEFSLVLDEVNRNVIAMQLAGKIGALSQTGAALTDIDVTVVKGKWVEIGHEFLDTATAVEVTNPSGTVTYVEGKDYLINPRLGLLFAQPDGAMTAGPAKLSAATKTVAGTRIVGGAEYSHTMRLKLDGVNLINREDIVLTAPQATVSAQDAFDFLSGKLATVPLKGLLEIAQGYDYPFDLRYPGA